MDARQRRRMWAIPYQLGVALIAEVHPWRTAPTDTHSNHRRFLGRAIVRKRWRTVLVRTALRRAEGMGVEKARAAFRPYRGRKLAAPVERLVRLSMAVPCSSCNAPLPRAPSPHPSPALKPNGSQALRPLPPGRLRERRSPRPESRRRPPAHPPSRAHAPSEGGASAREAPPRLPIGQPGRWRL